MEALVSFLELLHVAILVISEGPCAVVSRAYYQYAGLYDGEFFCVLANTTVVVDCAKTCDQYANDVFILQYVSIILAVHYGVTFCCCTSGVYPELRDMFHEFYGRKSAHIPEAECGGGLPGPENSDDDDDTQTLRGDDDEDDVALVGSKEVLDGGGLSDDDETPSEDPGDQGAMPPSDIVGLGREEKKECITTGDEGSASVATARPSPRGPSPAPDTHEAPRTVASDPGVNPDVSAGGSVNPETLVSTDVRNAADPGATSVTLDVSVGADVTTPEIPEEEIPTHPGMADPSPVLDVSVRADVIILEEKAADPGSELNIQSEPDVSFSRDVMTPEIPEEEIPTRPGMADPSPVLEVSVVLGNKKEVPVTTDPSSTLDVSSGIQQEIVSVGNQQEIVSAGIQQEIVSSGIQQEIVSSGIQQEIVSSGTQQEIVSSGTQQEIVSAGIQQEIVSSGIQQEIVSAGIQHEMVSAGIQQEIVSAGIQQEIVSSGIQHEIVSSGIQQEIVSSGIQDIPVDVRTEITNPVSLPEVSGSDGADVMEPETPDEPVRPEVAKFADTGDKNGIMETHDTARTEASDPGCMLDASVAKIPVSPDVTHPGVNSVKPDASVGVETTEKIPGGFAAVSATDRKDQNLPVDVRPKVGGTAETCDATKREDVMEAGGSDVTADTKDEVEPNMVRKGAVGKKKKGKKNVTPKKEPAKKKGRKDKICSVAGSSATTISGSNPEVSGGSVPDVRLAGHGRRARRVGGRRR